MQLEIKSNLTECFGIVTYVSPILNIANTQQRYIEIAIQCLYSNDSQKGKYYINTVVIRFIEGKNKIFNQLLVRGVLVNDFLGITYENSGYLVKIEGIKQAHAINPATFLLREKDIDFDFAYFCRNKIIEIREKMKKMQTR